MVCSDHTINVTNGNKRKEYTNLADDEASFNLVEQGALVRRAFSGRYVS